MGLIRLQCGCGAVCHWSHSQRRPIADHQTDQFSDPVPVLLHSVPRGWRTQSLSLVLYVMRLSSQSLRSRVR